MLRYYSYYSVGGYKVFLLGDSNTQVEGTYYFPLLPILEERAKSDNDVAKQVAELSALPAIKQLLENDGGNLPKSARILFSHAGYKLMYKHLEGNYYALALRDITNKAKDETGRNIPFLFVIIGDVATDRPILDKLATYMASNMLSTEKMFLDVLHMDVERNGLKFEAGKFNEWIAKISKSVASTTIPTINGQVSVRSSANKVSLLVLPNGIPMDKAISEQRLQGYDVISTNVSDIISKEDPEKLTHQLMRTIADLQEEHRKNALMKKSTIAAFIGGFTIGALIASCSSK